MSNEESDHETFFWPVEFCTFGCVTSSCLLGSMCGMCQEGTQLLLYYNNRCDCEDNDASTEISKSVVILDSTYLQDQQAPLALLYRC